jgi:hypothetical protein
MLVQKLERPLAVDLVQAVEEFDVGAVAEAKRDAADSGTSVGDPFVESDAVPVVALGENGIGAISGLSPRHRRPAFFGRPSEPSGDAQLR